jgi:hypothetical protein
MRLQSTPIPLPGYDITGRYRRLRGGPRPGAGRKPTGTPHLIRVGVALSGRHVALIRVHAFQDELPSQSAALREILDEYIEMINRLVPGFVDELDRLVAQARRPAPEEEAR